VLVAEGRPVPAAVKDGARVQVGRHTVRVVVPVRLLGHADEMTATARTR
jgi:hypothetical protein